jgi:sec-independent protein translocase protein TatA
MPPLAIMGLSMQELLIILAIVVLLFGARKIPEVARGLGEGIRGFRHSLKGDEDEGGDSAEPTAKETAKRSES